MALFPGNSTGDREEKSLSRHRCANCDEVQASGVSEASESEEGSLAHKEAAHMRSLWGSPNLEVSLTASPHASRINISNTPAISDTTCYGLTATAELARAKLGDDSAPLQLYEVEFSHHSSLARSDMPIPLILQLPKLERTVSSTVYRWVPYNFQSETDKIQRLSQTRSAAWGGTFLILRVYVSS